MVKTFPLRGVIGIVANAASELDLAASKRLQCVEVRADLLLDSGLSLDNVMGIVQQTRARDLACLFTLRHPSHGGKFDGDERQRAEINRQHWRRELTLSIWNGVPKRPSSYSRKIHRWYSAIMISRACPTNLN